MTKVLLFDVDGVLADTEEAHHLATSRAAGRPVDCSGGGSTQCKLRRAGFSEVEIPEIYERKRKLYEEFVQTALPNEELLQVLHAAARKYTLGACSNSSKASCHLLLRNIGVAPYMRVIITGGDVKRLKPAPDIYREALGRLCVLPKEVSVFEDSDEGMRAAYDAEIPLVIRCTTQTIVKELQKWL